MSSSTGYHLLIIIIIVIEFNVETIQIEYKKGLYHSAYFCKKKKDDFWRHFLNMLWLL